MLVAREVGSSYLPNLTFVRVSSSGVDVQLVCCLFSMGYKVGPHPPGYQWGETTPITRLWFQIFFMFTSIWGRFPFWLIFFRWVETTNQIRCLLTLRLSFFGPLKIGVRTISKPMFLTRIGFSGPPWPTDLRTWKDWIKGTRLNPPRETLPKIRGVSPKMDGLYNGKPY